MNNNKIMKIIIIIAVIIIPVMYSFFYLKAFWNPYDSLHDMKVAIVNLDEGDNDNNLGKELVNKLQEKGIMNFIILDNRDEAQKGLVNQDYYATITIPKDFTKTLNNAENSDRQVTTITYSPNQKSNYLASQIVNKVTSTVETELRGEVSQKVVSKLTEKLKEVPEKMQDISEGASKIQRGANSLMSGVETLSNGTEELENNYIKFNDGVNELYNGSSKLDEGINSLNQGIEQIADGSSKLEEGTKNLSVVTQGIDSLSQGASNLSSGVSQYVDGVNSAVSSVSLVSNQVKQLGTDITELAANPAVQADPNFQKVMNDLQKIKSSSSGMSELSTLVSKGTQLKAGANNLNTSIKTLANGTSKIEELQTGAKKLDTGVQKLKQGLSNAGEGSTSLKVGLNELNINSEKVLDGVKSINLGSKALLEGNKELQQGINTFKTEIDNGITDTKQELIKLDGLDEYVKEPVKIEEVDYAKVDSYGVGFAPYFMSISLWVGALIMLIIFYYDPEDRFKLLGRNAKNKFLRTGLYTLIAVAQGVVLGFLLKAGLGFSVTNIVLYYSSCILISMLFFSIIQFWVINFGDVGKFLSILLLVLQLAASGGTFPIETVPKGFQAIYNFMPMNYTIKLLKESLVKIDYGFIASNVWLIIGIFIVFIGINLGLDYFRIRKQKDKAI